MGAPLTATLSLGGERESDGRCGIDNLTPGPFDASMSWFSSRRERRLWVWTLLVVAAIYSTLGLATAWAGLLQDSGLLTVFFVGAMLLIGAAVVTRGLQVRPGGLEVAVALGVAAVYGLVFVRMALETERSHLIEYGVVALLIYEALSERASQGRRVPAPAVLAFLLAVLVGVVDEGIQWFVPVRVFDPLDMVFNALAAVMAVAASAALAWARRRSGRSRRRPSSRRTACRVPDTGPESRDLTGRRDTNAAP